MPSTLEQLRLEDAIARAQASALWRADPDAGRVADYLARYRNTRKSLDPEVRLVAANAELMVRQGLRPPPLTVGPVLFRSALIGMLSFLPLLFLTLSILVAFAGALVFFVASETRMPRRARLRALESDLQRARTLESPEYRQALESLEHDLLPSTEHLHDAG